MTSPVRGGRYEHRRMRRADTTTGEAFRPQQLRAHLALRLGLAQAQRDAAHGTAYGAAHAPFGGDHLLQEVTRVHDGAADTGAWDRALLHAGYRSVKGITWRCTLNDSAAQRRCHQAHPPRDGRWASGRGASRLPDIRISLYVSSPAGISRNPLSSSDHRRFFRRIHLAGLIGLVDSKKLCPERMNPEDRSMKRSGAF